MDVNEAYEKATMILEEEQTESTMHYVYVSTNWPYNKRFEQDKLQKLGYTPGYAALIGLGEERKIRPRHVYDDPALYKFVSTNFDLLVKVFSQLNEKDQALFLTALLDNYVVQPSSATEHNIYPRFPAYEFQSSSLGLLAEFCIRTGHIIQLLEATKRPKFPTASLVIMLLEIEDMIALNFNLFSDNQLEGMRVELAALRNVGERQTYTARGSRGGPMVDNPHYRSGYQNVGEAVVKAIDGIFECCRKARYFYLKGALQELPNLEIESDKLKVESFLRKLGFSGTMVGALNAAESDYKSTATTFELKNCLGHLRSFLEHLHREAAKSIATTAGEPVPEKWGDATLYLRQKGMFTKQHEAFTVSLYTLMSDTSVHPLGADQEYARLLRNVVIEYGVMFLTVLDKNGVKIS